jgi:hypothetical protein
MQADSYLKIITDITDPIVAWIKDDPVRPEIDIDMRVNHNSRIYALYEQEREQPLAITCVKFLETVPSSVQELVAVTEYTIAVFYTIWSYRAGSAADLIKQAKASISEELPNIRQFVTLSPKTDMARRFHLRNGASVLRENADTVNYIYP